MTEIPISIKKGQLPQRKITDDVKIELNNGLSKKKTPRLWWAVLITFTAVILCLAFYIFLNPIPKSSLYSNFLAQEPIVFSVINKDKLFKQIFPLSDYLQNQFGLFQIAINRFNDYISKADLSLERDILPLFGEKTSLAIFESQGLNTFPFIIILEKKAASAQINRVLGLFDQQLKKDFYLSDTLYRQNNITVIKSIYSASRFFYYAEVKNYFIISNDQPILEKTIDLIIKN